MYAHASEKIPTNTVYYSSQVAALAATSTKKQVSIRCCERKDKESTHPELCSLPAALHVAEPFTLLGVFLQSASDVHPSDNGPAGAGGGGEGELGGLDGGVGIEGGAKFEGDRRQIAATQGDRTR